MNWKETQAQKLSHQFLRCDSDGHRMFMEDRKADRVGGTTAVFTTKNKALYFFKGSYTIYGKKYIKKMSYVQSFIT